MKRTIAIIGLLVIGFTALAKPDTIKKAKADTVAKTAVKPIVYQPDPNQVYHVTLDLTEGQIFALMATSDGTLERSPNFNGAQIGQIKDEALIIRRMVNQQISAQKVKAYEKWKADTAAANKVKPLPVKAKSK